jgi:hypothetical protein
VAFGRAARGTAAAKEATRTAEEARKQYNRALGDFEGAMKRAGRADAYARIRSALAQLEHSFGHGAAPRESEEGVRMRHFLELMAKVAKEIARVQGELEGARPLGRGRERDGGRRWG